jgi:hypothetical protein
VLFRRLRVLGLLVSLAGVAGCTSTVAEPESQRADVAVRAYAAPSGAPAFCDALADTTQLTSLPVVLGTLTADPQDVEANLALTAAVGELQDVLDDVRARRGFSALGTSVEDLIAALRQARDGQLTDAVRAWIGTRLDDVGRQVQPVCDFPA